MISKPKLTILSLIVFSKYILLKKKRKLLSINSKCVKEPRRSPDSCFDKQIVALCSTNKKNFQVGGVKDEQARDFLYLSEIKTQQYYQKSHYVTFIYRQIIMYPLASQFGYYSKRLQERLVRPKRRRMMNDAATVFCEQHQLEYCFLAWFLMTLSWLMGYQIDYHAIQLILRSRSSGYYYHVLLHR